MLVGRSMFVMPEMSSGKHMSQTAKEWGQILALLGGAFYGGQKLERLDGGIRDLNRTMIRLADDTATKAELREFRLELRALNPELVVPN